MDCSEAKAGYSETKMKYLGAETTCFGAKIEYPAAQTAYLGARTQHFEAKIKGGVYVQWK
jgi:hypothetical protein